MLDLMKSLGLRNDTWDIKRIKFYSCFMPRPSFVYLRGQLPFLCSCTIGQTVNSRSPTNNHKHHILEACRVPTSSVLNILHLLF